MKQLILVRHAKSSWDLPVTDHERPLIEKGILAIQKVANHSKKILPNKFSIWSSTAKRTKNTAEIFCKTLNFEIEIIEFKSSLYTFSEVELTKIIQLCPNNIDNLIVFGHNNAITNFVNKFGNKLIYNVPTAGLVMFTFEETNWKNIQKGKIGHTLFPKEL